MSQTTTKIVCVSENDYVKYNVKFVIPTGNHKVILTITASQLKEIDWSNYLTKEYYNHRFSDQNSSSCDNGYLEICKKNGEIHFIADSLTGFKFSFSVDSAEMVNVFKKLDEWTRKVKFN